MKEETSKRNTGIELLRIAAMGMILCCHISGHYWHNKLAGNDVFLLNTTLDAFTSCGVDLFAMITGWVMCHSKIKISRLLEIWVQCFFYSVLIELAASCIMGRTLNLHVFRPLYLLQQWWYISSYFGMFFFIPFINSAVSALPAKKFLVFSLGVFLCCSAGNILIFYESIAGYNKGYSAVWLLCCYIFGASLRILHDAGSTLVRPKYNLYLLVLIAFFYLLYIWGGYFCGVFPKTASSGLLVRVKSYISPLTVLTAGLLLNIFSKIRIQNPVLQRFISICGSMTLGVYLLHDSNQGRAFFSKCSLFPDNPSVSVYLLNSVAGFLLIYAVCLLIDYIRSLIFRFCKVRTVSQYAEEKLRRSVVSLLSRLQI